MLIDVEGGGGEAWKVEVQIEDFLAVSVVGQGQLSHRHVVLPTTGLIDNFLLFNKTDDIFSI